jgi:hypothetical protein
MLIASTTTDYNSFMTRITLNTGTSSFSSTSYNMGGNIGQKVWVNAAIFRLLSGISYVYLVAHFKKFPNSATTSLS